jgi:hypothetical protein
VAESGRRRDRGHRAAVCHAGRLNQGSHVPDDIRREGAKGDGVCPAAVSPHQSSKTPQSLPGKLTKKTDTPTVERLLNAFADVSPTIIQNAAGEGIMSWLTPLSALQQDILRRLRLDTALYRQLEIHDIGNG